MIDKLNKIINESKKIVFFGGAGVSTESGIPDFRSVDGIYNQKYDYPPEIMISHSFFYSHPKEFYEFYFDKLVNMDVKPNITHLKLKELEDKGKLIGIVTQNIDGLHEMAGCKNVYTIHGTIYKNHCIKCNKEYKLDEIIKLRDKDGIPRCTCSSIIKPDVTLYAEMLPEKEYAEGLKAISEADTLIVAGTSLKVYPANSMINCFRGKNLIVINKDHLDIDADIQINDSIGNVFKQIKTKD